MALEVNIYQDEQWADGFNSIYGDDEDDLLGNLIDEVKARMALVAASFQVEIAQPDGTSEIVWRTDIGYVAGVRLAGDSLVRVLPFLNSQKRLGIINVHTPIPPLPIPQPDSDDDVTEEEGTILDIKQQEIGCNMCERRSRFRCKICKKAHYCTKKCHRRHKHRCY